MRRIFARTFLAVGFLLFLSQGAHAYSINPLRDVDPGTRAGGNQAVLATASIPAPLSTGSLINVGMDSTSTGTANGTSPINTGPVIHATDSTTNSAAMLGGGNVEIETINPATGAKVDISSPVKAAGTGSKACRASDVGAIRYNAAGNYMEICSYP